MSSEQIAVELPTKLIDMLDECANSSEQTLDEVVRGFLVDALLHKALSSRGQFYFDHINPLRQMKFPGIQDIPLPKKKGKK